MEDFLATTTSAELNGWHAYLQVDDEVQMQRTIKAMLAVLARVQPQQRAAPVEEEPVIDTTDPDFLKNFGGFIQGDPPPKQAMSPANLEIKKG